MTAVYLALGSNLDNRRANIEKAVGLLSRRLQQVKLASLYRSRPVGLTDQPEFINTAVSGQTKLSPEELLDFIKLVETAVGRQPRQRWGPREIDIDIIFYGERVIETAPLTVPHPLFRERDFVLRPLADLDPNLLDPVTKKTVEQLLRGLKPEQITVSGVFNS